MANSRSIRGTLDAASGVNSSAMTTLATRMVDAITDYYEGLVGSTMFNWVGPHFMDDNGTNTYTGSYPFYTNIVFQHLLSGHGINVSGNPQTNSNYGKWAFSTTNQGLKHLNDTVQFGKGISIGSAPGITNGANTGFISGTSLAPVAQSNNTYRTTNIKMSDFRGLKKTDPINNNYIYNAGDGVEEIYSSGPISVGGAA